MIGKRFFSFLFSLGALAFVLITAAGCEDTAPDASLPVITAPYYAGLAAIQPPPPRPEAVSVIQSPETEIWKPGYWEQSGAGFNWVSGEVVARPDPTAVWASPYWALRGYGWAFVPGYWQ